AGVCGRDITKFRREVIPVYAVIKKNTWLAISPDPLNNLGKYAANSQACLPVPDLITLISFNKLHESIRDHDREIEIAQISFNMLCPDERKNIVVGNFKNSHIGPSAPSVLLYDLSCLIKKSHYGYWAARSVIPTGAGRTSRADF